MINGKNNFLCLINKLWGDGNIYVEELLINELENMMEF